MKKTLLLVPALILVMCLTTAVYADVERKWKSEEVDAGIVDPAKGYKMGWDSFYHVVPNPGEDEMYASLADLLVEENVYDKAELSNLSDSELRDFAHKKGINYYYTEAEGLTEQIWAAQVEANPGETGMLVQEFEAAYGETGAALDKGEYWDAEEGYTGPDDGFGFVADDSVDAGYTVVPGEDYVGNYFHIDQLARISDGVLKRYIDISSPFNHSFLSEDLAVTGEAEVVDAFDMTNIEPGDAAEVVWHELF